MKAKLLGLNKYFKAGFLAAAALVISVSYQNCSKSDVSSSDMSASGLNSFSSLSSEDELFAMLQEARELSSLLRTYDLSQDSASDVLKTAPSVATRLSAKADLIEKAVTVDLIPTNSNSVLKEVDSLVNLLAQARDVRVAYDSIRRDKLLSLRIDDIKASLEQTIQTVAALGGAFNTFKDAITARVDGLTVQMGKWEGRLNAVNQAISDLATKNKAEDLALRAALEELKKYTETELAGVKDKSQTLEADLKKQAADAAKTQAELAAARAEMEKLGNISAKLCKYNDVGTITDSRSQCTSTTQAGDCCLTVNVIDCSALFVNSPAASNQCQILVTVIKNHDQQLAAIKAVDEKQDAAIGQLAASIDQVIGDISTINKNVMTLADSVDKIKAVTDELANQIGDIKEDMKKNDDDVKARLADLDTRTMLLEFKANRAEVINGLQSRASATLAWATMRYAHVNSAFCSSKRNQALAQFDYKATRQALEYCLEKRAIAVIAQAMANVANSYAGLLGGIGVDNDCSEMINGKPASSLSNAELLNDEALKEVTKKCKNGQVVAKVMMLNIVRYLKQIGPDHRTYDAMGSMSKAVNIAFFNSDWTKVSEADRKAFDNIDPTSEALKNTPYGQVERLFINNYYANAYRDSKGKFIMDPTKVNVNVSGSVYTEKQLLEGKQVGKNLEDYVKRVRSMEAEGYCTDCGFKITGRANPDSNKSSLVVSHGPGKNHFFYPNDPKPDLCPVDDDIVIRHNNGKHYVYHLSFDSWGNDILTPHLSRGLHTVIANSDADFRSGNFNSCGYEKDVKVERAGLNQASIGTRLTIRATRPYGQAYGRPQCTKLTAVCAVRQDDWTAPASALNMTVADLDKPASLDTFTRYINGFNPAVVNHMCQVQEPAYGEPIPTYDNSRNIASIHANRGIQYAWSNPNGSNASSRAQGYIELRSTQLMGEAYWPFQDGSLPYTGERLIFGKDKPFAAPISSGVRSSTDYIREVDLTDDIKVDECTHCPANLMLLGGCGKPRPPVVSTPAGTAQQ